MTMLVDIYDKIHKGLNDDDVDRWDIIQSISWQNDYDT